MHIFLSFVRCAYAYRSVFNCSFFLTSYILRALQRRTAYQSFVRVHRRHPRTAIRPYDRTVRKTTELKGPRTAIRPYGTKDDRAKELKGSIRSTTRKNAPPGGTSGADPRFFKKRKQSLNLRPSTRPVPAVLADSCPAGPESAPRRSIELRRLDRNSAKPRRRSARADRPRNVTPCLGLVEQSRRRLAKIPAAGPPRCSTSS